jgi:outer membrane protein TolC
MTTLVRFLVALAFVLFFTGQSTRAQLPSRVESNFATHSGQDTQPPLLSAHDMQDYVRDGKLVLSLEDAIRLAFANNSDIRLDQSALHTAANNLLRQFGPFDPKLNSFFNDQRQQTPAFQELQGAPVLNVLSQTAEIKYDQTFQTGTSVESIFSVNKVSTNSSFFFLNPYTFSNWQFQVTQPLIRNFGLLINRAPILIAQRGSRQARATFEGQVSDILLQVITAYWNVVFQERDLVVQRKSYEGAQQSYDRDKKALGLGALPPLDIYRPESQVAARRVNVIQAEHTLRLAQDQFRIVIGAYRDPATRVMDLDLTDEPRPEGELLTIDISTALDRAANNRPEFEAVRQQLGADDLKIRLAHNALRPDLELQGIYSTTGVGGNELSLTVPPVLVSAGGVTDSLNQIFHFNNPTYGFTLTLNLPIRNRAGRADLADAELGRRQDQNQEIKTGESVALDVTNSVHQLEETKLTLEAAKIAVELGEKNLRAEERKFDLGSQTAFFVLDAQNQLAQTELALASAQSNYQIALAALDHATGELLTRHHIEIK